MCSAQLQRQLDHLAPMLVGCVANHGVDTNSPCLQARRCQRPCAQLSQPARGSRKLPGCVLVRLRIPCYRWLVLDLAELACQLCTPAGLCVGHELETQQP